jgi:hypothetical protein
MRLLLLPVVLRLQIYRGYANRFVYDLRIFIPESLILRLGMHVMQNKKTKKLPSTTPECADTSKKRKETVNRIEVAGQRHLENQGQHTLRAQAFFVLIAHGRLYS